MDNVITVRLDPEQITDLRQHILKPVEAVLKTIKYIVGIAERGHGRKMREDETAEAFVLSYVQLLEDDASRLDWLQTRTGASGYAVKFQQVRNPAAYAGMNRMVVTTGVGSGPWEHATESYSLRAAIDEAKGT